MDEMSFDVLDELNWPAVVVATAIYYGLAGPWFADPLFGRAAVGIACAVLFVTGALDPQRPRPVV
jgi:hypothetical protein